MLLPSRHRCTAHSGNTRTGGNVTPAAVVSGTRRRGFRLVTATAFAALAVTAMTACGSDNSEDSTPSSSAAATSASAAETTTSGDTAEAGAPTAPELEATLNGIADPNTPAADKQKLIVDGDKRAANLDAVTKALANYGSLTFTVADITTEGDEATGQVTIQSPHGPAGPMPMTWQHSEQGWQLSDASACQILAMGQAPCRP